MGICSGHVRDLLDLPQNSTQLQVSPPVSHVAFAPPRKKLPDQASALGQHFSSDALPLLLAEAADIMS